MATSAYIVRWGRHNRHEGHGDTHHHDHISMPIPPIKGNERIRHPTDQMKQPPNFSREQLAWMESTFIPVKDTRGIDLREIDFRSGQYSVVVSIKSIVERQSGNAVT